MPSSYLCRCSRRVEFFSYLVIRGSRRREDVSSYTQGVNPDSQVLLSVSIPTIAVLVGILINNRQIDRLERHLDVQIGSVRAEIASLWAEMDARFQAAHEALLRVEGILDARLKHLEEDR